MAKRNERRSHVRSTHDSEEPYGLNEVDDFAAKREKIMLKQAGITDTNKEDSDLSLDEEEVLGFSDASSSSDSIAESDVDSEEGDLDGEAVYKKVFGRQMDNDAENEVEKQGMLDNDNAWGTSKNEYYGADDLSDDEAAKEIEREALRQQKKHLQDLQMDDYLEEEVESEWVKNAKEFDMGQFLEGTHGQQTNISVKDVLSMDADSKSNFLKTSFPEFLPLAKEFTKLSPELEILVNADEDEIRNIKYVALSAYLGSISTYFALFLHELQTNEDFVTMKDHPVMERILECKEIWRQANALSEHAPEFTEQNSEIEDNVSDISEMNEEILLEQDEVEEDQEEDSNNLHNEVLNDSEDESSENDEEDFDIELIDRKVVSTVASDQQNDVDDYVESKLADVDAQEKNARKKTLRFYTAKIDQKANKKTDRFKGDDDIPYKERLYERQQRLLEEARKRGLSDKNFNSLNNDEFDSEDEKVAKEINGKSVDDYYEQVKVSKQNKKAARLQAHKDAVTAFKEGKLAELAEQVGEDGKRAINYQILKNKGLTPKRKKDNRNSRVKKRKKYEKAQKKLKSVRAVYSGGQSGAYEGEKTGIKKNLTKSVKFKS